MKQKPRSSKAGVFSDGLGADMVYQGFMVSALTLAAYFIGSFIEHGNVFSFTAQSSHGITMAFLTMSMAEIFHSYNMRSQRGSIFRLKKHNVFLFGAMVAALILTTAVIEVPFLADAFGFTVIGWKEYAIALALAVTVIPIVEIIKLVQRAVSRRKAAKADKA